MALLSPIVYSYGIYNRGTIRIRITWRLESVGGLQDSCLLDHKLGPESIRKKNVRETEIVVSKQSICRWRWLSNPLTSPQIQSPSAISYFPCI